MKTNVVMNLFSVQLSVNNSVPSLATFSQSLSELLNNTDTDIIVNVAISDLSLYKVCNPNHLESQHYLIIPVFSISLNTRQSVAWWGKNTQGSPPSTGDAPRGFSAFEMEETDKHPGRTTAVTLRHSS